MPCLKFHLDFSPLPQSAHCCCAFTLLCIAYSFSCHVDAFLLSSFSHTASLFLQLHIIAPFFFSLFCLLCMCSRASPFHISPDALFSSFSLMHASLYAFFHFSLEVSPLFSSSSLPSLLPEVSPSPLFLESLLLCCVLFSSLMVYIGYYWWSNYPWSTIF